MTKFHRRVLSVRVVVVATVVLLLVLSPGAVARAWAAPRDGQEGGVPAYRLVEPRGDDPVSWNVGLVFRELGPDEAPWLRAALDGSPAVQDLLERYRRLRADAGLEPTPVTVALLWQQGDVAFAWVRPMLFYDAEGLRYERVPAVHLGGRDLEALRDHGPSATGTFCHELGHLMRYASHGDRPTAGGWAENLVMILKQEGHWLGKLTDGEFALEEGWSEFLEWYAMDEDPGERYLRRRTYHGSRIVSRDSGLVIQFKPEADQDDRPVDAATLRASEAAVGTVLLRLARSGVFEDSLDTYLAAMRRHRPRDLDEFLLGLYEDHPGRGAELDRALSAASLGVLPAPPAPPMADTVRGVGRVAEALRDLWDDPGRALRRFRRRLEPSGPGDGK